MENKFPFVMIVDQQQRTKEGKKKLKKIIIKT